MLGDALAFGFGGFLASFFPLSLLPMHTVYFAEHAVASPLHFKLH
jgi:hypothetical protein